MPEGQLNVNQFDWLSRWGLGCTVSIRLVCGKVQVFYYIWHVMRRVYAMILLIPVLTLFAGSVTLASSCAKMAVAASHKECAGCGQKCHSKQPGKCEQKEKDGGGYCIDCPLCCLVTFKPFFRLEFTRQVITIDYTVMSDNNLGDYFQRHWKPPDRPFLSQFQQTFFHC
jgi:hypothetical protein